METTCFAALVVEFENVRGHMTIGVNKAATPEEVACMSQELDEIVGPAMPFDLVIADKAKVGINARRKRDALILEAVDPVVESILSSFYKRHSKRVRHGCPLAFSDLVMHLTLTRASIAEPMVAVGTRVTVAKTLFESRNDAADTSTRFTGREWTCLRCETTNPITSKQCTGRRLGLQCLQWRPKALISVAHRKREGDWRCCGCGEDQYATRTECRRCGIGCDGRGDGDGKKKRGDTKK